MSQNRKTGNSLQTLADKKRLPLEFLKDLGLHDAPLGGIGIPYYGSNREVLFTRLRDAPGRPRFDQPKGVPLEAYGQWRLPEARQRRFLNLVEGESDCWTLWFRRLPALGIPGAAAAGVLLAEHVQGLDDVYVMHEPGSAGDQFVQRIHQRLLSLGFNGTVWEIRFTEDTKDPSDLYVANPETFLERWGNVVRAARRLERPPPPVGNGRRLTVQELVARHLGAVESCSHDDLLDANLPPPSWLVDGLIIDEGLTLLGGKKKLGKSWFCLQVAQAIATGSDCLGRKTVQGDVIYVCLEDGKRRLKSRLLKQQTVRGLPITYYTRFPPLDGEGMERLLELLDSRKPRLLIIDTLAAAKTGKVDENAAGGMADLGNALRALAQVYKSGILATHHHGKLTGGDPGDDLRGSSALAAAGDVNLGLYREQDGHRIRGEGRDIGELSLPLTFDPELTWSWQVRGDQREVLRQDADQAILAALRSLGEATASEVALLVNRSRQETAERLNRLTAQGQVRVRVERREGRGRPRMLYSLALVVVEQPEEDEEEIT